MVSEDKSINHFSSREIQLNALGGLRHSVPAFYSGSLETRPRYWRVYVRRWTRERMTLELDTRTKLTTTWLRRSATPNFRNMIYPLLVCIFEEDAYCIRKKSADGPRLFSAVIWTCMRVLNTEQAKHSPKALWVIVIVKSWWDNMGHLVLAQICAARASLGTCCHWIKNRS